MIFVVTFASQQGEYMNIYICVYVCVYVCVNCEECGSFYGLIYYIIHDMIIELYL